MRKGGEGKATSNFGGKWENFEFSLRRTMSLAKTRFLRFVYTSVPLMHCAVRMRHVTGTRLINLSRTWGEQRTTSARKRHLAHPVLFVFTQKTDKFQFVVNGMRTVRRRRRPSLQSRPHIRTFGANNSARSSIRGFTWMLSVCKNKEPLLSIQKTKIFWFPDRLRFNSLLGHLAPADSD